MYLPSENKTVKKKKHFFGEVTWQAVFMTQIASSTAKMSKSLKPAAVADTEAM